MQRVVQTPLQEIKNDGFLNCCRMITKLEDLLKNEECYSSIDTLEVNWVIVAPLWTWSHQCVLGHLLNHFKVKKLILTRPPNFVEKWCQNLFEKKIMLLQNLDFPFLYHLRSIVIDNTHFGWNYTYTVFVERSRTVEVINMIYHNSHNHSSYSSDQHQHFVNIAHRCQNSFSERLQSNFSLREIRYICDNGFSIPRPIFPSIPSAMHTDVTKAVELALARNCRAYLKCRNATIVLLGIRKLRKERAPHRDAFGIVIQMVWASCGLVDWVK